MDLRTAAEVFMHGHCLLKSAAHPYVYEPLEELWMMRDGPGRKNARCIEVIACEASPERTVELIRGTGIEWHFLGALHSDPEEYEHLRARYKALGYRATSTEWMFTHDLADVPDCVSQPPVAEVRSQAELNAVPQVASHKRKLLPGTRVYGVWDEGRDYGWVTTIPFRESAWAADLFVHTDFRRCGYGRALMSRHLQDVRNAGLTSSVLLASTAGAKLYPVLGYRQLATLQLFCPATRK